MGRIIRILSLAVAVLSAVSLKGEGTARISVFSDHIRTISRQEGIPFAAAAAKVKAIGYSGVDVRVGQSPSELRALDDLGFEHSCAIADIDFSPLKAKSRPGVERKAIAFMKKNGYSRLLLVPALLPEGASGELKESVRNGIIAFADKAAEEGIEVVVEDFDNPRSPCATGPVLEDLLAGSARIGLLFDSGNYLPFGEDAYRAVLMNAGKVRHVHLKDRVSCDDLTCTPAGEGCIPVSAIVKKLASSGYDGWYTVEQFGSKSMLADVKTSYDNIVKALGETGAGFKIGPSETEYYDPAVPVVDASGYDGCVQAPEGALVLFAGNDLSEWKGPKGGDARWRINGDGSMTVVKSAGDIVTRREFGSYHLHLEWMVPSGIHGEGQSRGNSGVFLNGAYEVQILDSHGNGTYVNGMAASIYKQSVPSANPCKAPGSWNVYDITFTAPEVDADGNLLKAPRVTVVFNGVTVQDDREILGTTEYIGFPRSVWAVRGPISLQSHGDPSEPISFRNIWIKEL